MYRYANVCKLLHVIAYASFEVPLYVGMYVGVIFLQNVII